MSYIELYYDCADKFKQKTMDFLLDMIDKDKKDKGKDKKDGKKSKEHKTKEKEADIWGRILLVTQNKRDSVTSMFKS